MRTPPFLLIGVPVIVLVLAVAYFVTHPGVRHPVGPSASQVAFVGSAAPAETQPTDGKSHHLIDQLDLTDAQRQQIAQIRQTTTDHKQRHQAILKVLTPEQRTRLKELRAQGTSPTPTAPPPAAGGT